MKQKKEYTGMPLFLWGISVLSALAILSIIYLVFTFSSMQPGKNKTILIREKTHIYDLNRKLDAYFIGSSLTRVALFSFNSLENTIIKNYNRFNFKIAVGNGFSLDEFNYKVKEIKMLRPKCLFIESNLLCIDPYGNILSGFRHRLARIPVDLINTGRLNNVNAGFLTNNFNGQFNPDFKAEKNKREPESELRIRGSNEFPLWNRFFREAEKHGIKIYLIEVPRSIESEQYLSNSVKQKLTSLVEKYSIEYGVGYIGFPEKLSYDRYYFDRTHFNRPGAELYSDWLVNEILKRELLK